LHTCLVSLECTAKGALPWKDEKSGELYFPDDEAGNRNRRRLYHVTGYELMAAFELNALSNVKIKEVHRFPLTVEFNEYINHFYELRERARLNNDIAGRIFGKYFMNSLYGKFGSDPENYAEYVIATDDSIAKWIDEGYHRIKPWRDRHLMCRKPSDDELNDSQGKWRYYNVATAASVTGYVRAFLFKSISQCAGVLYCDTDSIAARDTRGLRFGPELGNWKNEGSYDRAAIAGKKLYAFHRSGLPFEYDPDEEDEKRQTWKIACKGVNFRKGMKIDGRFYSGPELITKIAEGEKIEYEPESPTFSLFRDVPDLSDLPERYRELSEKSFIARDVRRTAKDMSQAPEPA
jgi:hypothetical protein